MSAPLCSRRSRPISLSWAIGVPLVLQLLGTLGLVGYWAWTFRQNAVTTLATQLMGATSLAVEERLEDASLTPAALESLRVSPSGAVFVLDPEGLAIATPETPSPLLESATRFIQQLGGVSAIQQSQHYRYQSYFLQVRPYQDSLGDRKVIVAIAPRSDFEQSLPGNAPLFLGLGMGALLALAMARWLLRVRTSPTQSLDDPGEELPESPLLETKLRTSEAEIRRFFEGMTDLVLFVNAATRNITVAPTHPERLYEQETEILNQTIEQFYLEEGAEQFWAQVKLALDTQQVIDFEYSLSVPISPDSPESQTYWFAASLSPTSAHTVAWVARDISARKSAIAALQESEARFRSLVDNIPGIVYRCTFEQGQMMEYLSETVETITGYTAQELIGNRVQSWVTLIHPDDRDSVLQTIQSAIAALAPFVLEYRIQHRDGSLHWLYEKGQATPARGSRVQLEGAIFDISDRKQAEESLQASQQRLSFLVEQTPLAIVEWNTRWEVVAWNQAAQKIFGYEKSEILGRQGIELIVPQPERDRVKQVLQELSLQQGGRHNVNTNMTQDGQMIICEWYNTALIDEHQQTIGYASMAVDITQRRQAELALQHSEQFLRSIYEGVETAIFIVEVLEGGEFRLGAVNPAYERRSGSLASELCGKTLFEVLPTAIATATLQHCQTCVATAAQLTYEECFHSNLDAPETWWLTTLNPIRSLAQDRIDRLIGTSIDISDRKQAEQVLQQRAATETMLLTIARAFLDEDFDRAVATALATLGEFTNSDRAYLMSYDRERDATLTTHEWQGVELDRALSPHPPIPNGLSSTWYKQELLGGHLVQIPCISDLPVEASAWKTEMLAHSIQSVMNVPITYQNQVVGLLGLDTVRHPKIWSDDDIHLLKLVGEIIAIGIARHKAEEAQKSAVAEAFAANRAKSEFLANMSHELRTPLTAILGLSEVLRDEVFGPLTAKQHQKLATIEQSGQHLLELINDILDLAKIESGKLELQLVPTNIEGLCEASLAFVRQQAHQKQIALSAKIPPRLGKITVDERRVRQVLINLLSNAVKFTPEQGEVWIEVLPDEENEVLHFSIVDTGIGIASEDISRLFQPFVQLDSSLAKSYPGTGLGLALVRQVVELHRGSVKLESQVGEGSRFTVSLPWHKSVETVTALPQPLEERAFTYPTLQKVLIVEDSLPVAEQVTRYLAELGVNEVAVHALGTGSLDKALLFQPDTVILDLQLPDRSGWDVLAQLKGHPQTQAIPVLIISVVDEPGARQDLGASEYLMKPFSRSQFQIAWRKLMRASQPPVEATSATQAPLILMAEDNEANISTIVEYLEVKGYRVAIAMTGKEAVQLATQLRPHLILMDIQMPEMDGLEATRQIRTERSLAQIPIIALTSLAMPGDEEKCLEAGVNEYLAKPVSLKKISERDRRLPQTN
ncbi:MAG: PAS domain S-box protein [Desertifilum sp.]|nr:PAS domain S-box protein [Desertifilum sp.]